MPSKSGPDLSLFIDILQTFEEINAPYMVIGAFAAAIYGSTRLTYDIDVIVALKESHIQTLVASYPPPRYYADVKQIRDSVRFGTMFNIIDTTRGEKADLLPLTVTSAYRQGFRRRIRQVVELPGKMPFEIWCARPDDVILGKLMAWNEGHSRKHESDIYEMMVVCTGPQLSKGTPLKTFRSRRSLPTATVPRRPATILYHAAPKTTTSSPALWHVPGGQDGHDNVMCVLQWCHTPCGDSHSAWQLSRPPYSNMPHNVWRGPDLPRGASLIFPSRFLRDFLPQLRFPCSGVLRASAAESLHPTGNVRWTNTPQHGDRSSTGRHTQRYDCGRPDDGGHGRRLETAD